MKKGKIILGAIAYLSAITGIFAFKINNRFAGTPNIYVLVGGIYNHVFENSQYPKLNPAELTDITIPATGSYYYRSPDGVYHPLPAGTKTYTIIK